MSALVPPKLANLARELRLGEMEVRFGYRPGVVGGALVVFFGVSATVGLFRIALGEVSPVFAVVPLVILGLVAWRVRRMYLRFRGGVYLFEGGIAEAYGDRVKKIFTWSEVSRSSGIARSPWSASSRCTKTSTSLRLNVRT